jgi:branched-chain amino acid transport system substrate-binding protein
MKKTTILTLFIAILVLLGISFYSSVNTKNNKIIKIGLITDLSGPAAYFGGKSLLGAEMVKKDFKDKGIDIEIISEDYQLEASKAATIAQKLINIDKVDLIYTDFNPGAIAVSSVLSDKEIPFIYVAAIETPLSNTNSSFKVYLDYREGCKMIASKFKEKGIEKIGLLKVSLEFGDLCAEGVKEIYGDNSIVEGYNLGDTDFRTQLVKLKSQNVEAIINTGFEGDTYNTLKNMKDLKLNLPYGTVSDTLTSKVLDDFKNELVGGLAFGYQEIDQDFKNKIESYKNEKIDNVGPEYIATALVYTHLSQSIDAILECGDDKRCFTEEMSKKTSPNILGFQRFEDRVAVNQLKLFEF